MSGATPLAALDPHVRRFSVHPLQTFTPTRGPEQLDGAWAAVTAETERGARASAPWLAETLGLRAVRARRRARDRSTTRARRSRRTTSSRSTAPRRAARGGGRAARGARAADAPHDRERLRADRPDRARRLGDGRRAPRGDPRRRARARAAVRALAEATGAVRRRAHDRRAARRARAAPGGDVGLVPTMGALSRRPPRRSSRRARGVRHRRRSASSSTRRSSASRGPRRAIRATRRATPRSPRSAGVDVLFAPAVEEMYPPGFQTWVDVEELGAILEGEFRPGHFRGVATVCLKLFTSSAPTRVLRPEGRAAGRRHPAHGARPRSSSSRSASLADRARRRRAGALVAQRPALRRRARARARAPARARDAATPTRRARACSSRGLDVDYVEVAPFDRPSSPPPSASARPA